MNYIVKKKKARIKKKIKSILVFFNNYRGLKLSKFLAKKNFETCEIVTTKFLNKKILSKLNKNSHIIKDLKSKRLKKFIKKSKFDLIISAGFPHIFKKDYFNLAPYGIINLHAGKLPKYRGGSPLVWQIINNEKTIGLSVIKINSSIDGGSIISTSSFKNNKKDAILDVHNKADKIFLKITLDAIRKIENNKKFKKQPLSNSYFYQRKDRDALINFKNSNIKTYNFVRSQNYPYKGAFFYNGGKKFRLIKCIVKNFNPKISSGTIFKLKKKKNIYIKCKKNSVQIMYLLPKVKFLKKVITL